MRPYLTLRQVAKALGKEPWWMYRHLKRLQAEHGFPRRDAAMGGFDALAVTAWQDRRAGIGPAMVGPVTPPEDIAAWADELDRRAGALN